MASECNVARRLSSFCPEYQTARLQFHCVVIDDVFGPAQAAGLVDGTVRIEAEDRDAREQLLLLVSGHFVEGLFN